MKLLVIYHGNCADGFTSAWAVWKKFPDAEFYAGVYGKPPPDVSGKTVVIVDFSYKKSIIYEMAKSAKSILILDHHKSAAQDLEEFCEPPQLIWSGWLPDSGVYATLDMERSGARITWDHFHGTEPGFLVKHVEDRDLWRFSMEQTKAFQANVFSYEYTFKNWEMINAICSDDYKYQEFIDAGKAIERKHLKDIRELLKVCQRNIKIAGYFVPSASLPYTMSTEAGNLMSEGEPFAACYWDTVDSRIFSLRSNDDGLDVSEIAKSYGGGGHRNAAGFRVDRSHELAKM